MFHIIYLLLLHNLMKRTIIHIYINITFPSLLNEIDASPIIPSIVISLVGSNYASKLTNLPSAQTTINYS